MPLSRLALRYYQTEKLYDRFKDAETTNDNARNKEWYDNYKGTPGLDGFDIDDLKNWKLHTTTRSAYKYDMPKQIQAFRSFLHKFEGHLENESEVLKMKLAYDLKKAKFEDVFTPSTSTQQNHGNRQTITVILQFLSSIRDNIYACAAICHEICRRRKVHQQGKTKFHGRIPASSQ